MGGPIFPTPGKSAAWGRAAAMLMVRDSILADERSSGAEDDLLRKTQKQGKKRERGSFFVGRGENIDLFGVGERAEGLRRASG